NMPTYNMPSPSASLPTPGTKSTGTTIPPTGTNVPGPTFGVPPPPEKAPRTGIGANYSETAAQVLNQKPSVWQEKKFYILGVIMALLFVGTLLFFGTLGKGGEALAVITSPAGADVLIDGKKIGVTPTSIAEKKDMSVTLHLQGYQDKVLTLQKSAWPSEVN